MFSQRGTFAGRRPAGSASRTALKPVVGALVRRPVASLFAPPVRRPQWNNVPRLGDRRGDVRWEKIFPKHVIQHGIPDFLEFFGL
jgi:hypothetical protein